MAFVNQNAATLGLPQPAATCRNHNSTNLLVFQSKNYPPINHLDPPPLIGSSWPTLARPKLVTGFVPGAEVLHEQNYIPHLSFDNWVLQSRG